MEEMVYYFITSFLHQFSFLTFLSSSFSFLKNSHLPSLETSRLFPVVFITSCQRVYVYISIASIRISKFALTTRIFPPYSSDMRIAVAKILVCSLAGHVIKFSLKRVYLSDLDFLADSFYTAREISWHFYMTTSHDAILQKLLAS